ncbi:MAG: serine hydrolase domain-containing protein [Actinomycetales bacterium]
MPTTHDARTARVAEVMADHASERAAPGAPGAVWAIASGPREDRRTTVAATGGLAEDTLFRTSSVTKLTTTVLVLALVEDGVLALDSPLTRWVPTWRGREVLRVRHGGVEDTVLAARDLTVRDLLLMGLGLGYDLAAPPDDELTAASMDAGIMSGWSGPALDPEQWALRVASLPMHHQPGRGWLYQSSFDALTVVVELATGRRFDEVLRERVLGPASMTETGYAVPVGDLHRVPAFVQLGADGAATELAPAAEPALADRPAFCSGAAGLVSTASDLLAFAQVLLDGGVGPGGVGLDSGPSSSGAPDTGAAPGSSASPGRGGPDGVAPVGVAPGSGRILGAGSVEAMRTDALSDETREMAAAFLEPGWSWGLGAGIDDAGGFGWDGGTGTSLFVYPERQVAGVLLTRRGMAGPTRPTWLTDFWSAVLEDPQG